MTTPYNQYNIVAAFKSYLFAENIQPVSTRNYLSDIRHFLGWLATTGEALPQTITESRLSTYISTLQQAQTPPRTLQRRLSTIRKFCKFCIAQNWLSSDPSRHLHGSTANNEVALTQLATKYSQYLHAKGFSEDVINEKLSDVKNLLKI